MKRLPTFAAAGALLAVTAFAPAAIITTNNPDLTTPANAGGSNTDATGIWFNPLNGYAEVRGTTFPTTLFEDGKFWLLLDASFATPAAQVFTQGFFSRGNGVIYASTSNLNPARFGDGAVIGPGVGYQSPGTGFADLGPTFGNFATGGHGYIGLTVRDPSRANATDVFYGYAEVNVNAQANYATTLLNFAYNNVRGAPITTVTTVPEPTVLAGAVVLAAGLLGRRRRTAQ